MARPSLAEGYGIAAAVLLILLAVVNVPAVTLAVSAVGLLVGLFVIRRAGLTRTGYIAVAGFAAAAALALFVLLR